MGKYLSAIGDAIGLAVLLGGLMLGAEVFRAPRRGRANPSFNKLKDRSAALDFTQSRA